VAGAITNTLILNEWKAVIENQHLFAQGTDVVEHAKSQCLAKLSDWYLCLSSGYWKTGF
jgi:hypothetical protein